MPLDNLLCNDATKHCAREETLPLIKKLSDLAAFKALHEHNHDYREDIAPTVGTTTDLGHR